MVLSTFLVCSTDWRLASQPRPIEGPLEGPLVHSKVHSSTRILPPTTRRGLELWVGLGVHQRGVSLSSSAEVSATQHVSLCSCVGLIAPWPRGHSGVRG